MIDTTSQDQAAYAAAVKLSQPKAAYADQCTDPAQGYSPAHEPLAAQLGRRILRESDNVYNLRRAADILIRHPEFEELIWLIRSNIV